MSTAFSFPPDTKARMAMLANLLAEHESRTSDDRLASITTIVDRTSHALASQLQIASPSPGDHS